MSDKFSIGLGRTDCTATTVHWGSKKHFLLLVLVTAGVFTNVPILVVLPRSSQIASLLTNDFKCSSSRKPYFLDKIKPYDMEIMWDRCGLVGFLSTHGKVVLPCCRALETAAGRPLRTICVYFDFFAQLQTTKRIQSGCWCEGLCRGGEHADFA